MIAISRFLIQCTFFFICIFLMITAIESEYAMRVFHALFIFPSLASLPFLTLPTFFVITFSILLFTCLFGRIYCSFFCPIGFMQDVVFKMVRFAKKKSFPFSAEFPTIFQYIRMFILSFCLFSILLTYPLYTYFDQYSQLARVLSFRSLDVSISSTEFILGFIFILLLICPPVFFPRFFCNVICPSGTLFSLLQKFALFRFVLQDDACKSCHTCQSKCPSRSISGSGIDIKTCIYCFECLSFCGFKSIFFRFKSFLKKATHTTPKVSLDRRRFFKTISLFSLGGLFLYGNKKASFFALSHFQNRAFPPGGSSIERFTSLCSSCNLCLSVCPTKVLKKTFHQQKTLFALPRPHLGPYLDFDHAFCSYECNECLKICPTGAIQYVPLPDKKVIRIGKVRLFHFRCISYNEGRDCNACAELCPTGAITTKKLGSTFVPVTHEDYCIGCGACQYACPVTPKAILAIPLDIHELAYRPSSSQKKDPLQGTTNDFPF